MLVQDRDGALNAFSGRRSGAHYRPADRCDDRSPSLGGASAVWAAAGVAISDGGTEQGRWLARRTDRPLRCRVSNQPAAKSARAPRPRTGRRTPASRMRTPSSGACPGAKPSPRTTRRGSFLRQASGIVPIFEFCDGQRAIADMGDGRTDLVRLTFAFAISVTRRPVCRFGRHE